MKIFHTILLVYITMTPKRTGHVFVWCVFASWHKLFMRQFIKDCNERTAYGRITRNVYEHRYCLMYAALVTQSWTAAQRCFRTVKCTINWQTQLCRTNMSVIWFSAATCFCSLHRPLPGRHLFTKWERPLLTNRPPLLCLSVNVTF
jgi:hypothetical protein